MAMVGGIFWFLFSAFVNDLCLLLDLVYVYYWTKINQLFHDDDDDEDENLLKSIKVLIQYIP